MPKKSFGFTLIELLISISIISILSTIGFVEYRTFSASQVLTSSINELQSLLRIAQSNATSSLSYQNHACKNWVVKFNTNAEGSGTAGTDISLICQPANSALPDIVKLPNLTLPPKVTISSITSSCNISFPTYSASVAFSALYGKPSLIIARAVPDFECNSSSDMTITLSYEQDSNTIFSKKIVVSKGGGIDAK